MRNMIVIGLLAASSVAAMADERRLTILHTNDFHGRLEPFEVAPGNATSQTGDPGRAWVEFGHRGTIGGFAYLAAEVKRFRETAGADRVLLLDAGDTFGDSYVGNETRGAASIKLMNTIGYDFMALGNHDFDYGLERSRELQALAEFPVRAANVLEEGAPVFGRPWEVFVLDGVRIAVLGLGYHNTGQTSGSDNIEGLAFTDGIEATREVLPELREAADIVVVVSHQGTKTDRLLASKVDGIDVIVGGHSHDKLEPPEKIGDTWVVQALSDAAMLGETRLIVDESGSLVRVEGAVHSLWNDRIDPDPTVGKMLAELTQPFDAKRDEVLTTSTDRIGRQYRSESPFDVLVGDILRERTGADIAMMPGVGYGLSFAPGPVTRDALYTLIPHPAKMVTLEMSGADIVAILEQSATNQNPVDPQDTVGGLVQTSNLAWTADLSRPVGDRVSDVTMGGDPIRPDAWYKIATNSGMANGLHRYDFAGARNKVVHDITVTRVVEEAFADRDVISAPQSIGVRIIPPAEAHP